MGIFDSNESEDEVQISPDEENSTQESKLKSEVESKVVPGGTSTGEEDSTVSGVASGSQVSNNGSSKNVSIEDVYRQNERIIELLEEIAGDSIEDEKGEGSENNEFDGDLNGVL